MLSRNAGMIFMRVKLAKMTECSVFFTFKTKRYCKIKIDLHKLLTWSMEQELSLWKVKRKSYLSGKLKFIILKQYNRSKKKKKKKFNN